MSTVCCSWGEGGGGMPEQFAAWMWCCFDFCGRLVLISDENGLVKPAIEVRHEKQHVVGQFANFLCSLTNHESIIYKTNASQFVFASDDLDDVLALLEQQEWSFNDYSNLYDVLSGAVETHGYETSMSTVQDTLLSLKLETRGSLTYGLTEVERLERPWGENPEEEPSEFDET